MSDIPDEIMSEVRRVSRLLIAAGLLALLTACESLPDEKALAVNDPAFDPAIIWNPRDALPEGTKKNQPYRG